jgi:hypothetical protein
VDQPTAAGTDTTGPAARYGRPPSPARRRAAVGAAVVLLLGAVAWALWTAIRLSDDPVSWDDVGFAVRADDRIEVTFDVHFNDDVPPDARAVCTVHALNRIHAEVGLVDVVVGPASRGSIRLTTAVPTGERAVTGLVKDCAVE